MNYLAIDTSGKNLSIVVCNEGKVFSFFDDNCGVKHSDKIMVEIENLIEKAEYDIKKSDFIACVVGAGSFTGIRIGVATVKALCFAYSLPALSVTSFDTLAYNEKSGKVLAVIDAGHDGFYVCGYNDNVVEIEPCYIMKEQLIELEKDYKICCSTDIDNVKTKKVSVLDGLINAVSLLSDKRDDNLDNLSPLYVRKSQAEEGR